MADDDLANAVLRAFALGGDPLKSDAFRAMVEKGASALDRISDDLVRELYAFLCGLFSGMFVTGNTWGGDLLAQLQAPGARDNPATMRQALKSVWK